MHTPAPVRKMPSNTFSEVDFYSGPWLDIMELIATHASAWRNSEELIPLSALEKLDKLDRAIDLYNRMEEDLILDDYVEEFNAVFQVSIRHHVCKLEHFTDYEQLAVFNQERMFACMTDRLEKHVTSVLEHFAYDCTKAFVSLRDSESLVFKDQVESLGLPSYRIETMPLPLSDEDPEAVDFFINPSAHAKVALARLKIMVSEYLRTESASNVDRAFELAKVAGLAWVANHIAENFRDIDDEGNFYTNLQQKIKRHYLNLDTVFT